HPPPRLGDDVVDRSIELVLNHPIRDGLRAVDGGPDERLRAHAPACISLPRRPLRRSVFDPVPKIRIPVWAYRTALSAGCSDLGRRRPRDSESHGHSHRPAWTRPVALNIQATRESSPAVG